jgi:hypothetical protein
MAASTKSKSVSNAPFSLGMKKDFIEAPPFRPGLNIGCLHDIPTGRYVRGYDGHFYHTGGVGHVEGVGGRGNTHKSSVTHHKLLTCLDRYWPAEAQSRDTEYSQSYQRFQNLANGMDRLSAMDLANIPEFLITSQGDQSGNAWFKDLTNYFTNKKNAAKEITRKTPFVDPVSGKFLTLLIPTLLEIDSLSGFTTDVVEGIFEKNEIGDGSANTVYMRASGAKSQLVMQLPGIMSSAGGYMIFTAHMGDDIQIDPYAAPAKKLAFMKSKLKFKQVPENITFLTTNLFIVLNVQLEHTKEHVITYPKGPGDNLEHDPDLQRLTIQNLRAKNGPTGLPFDLITSQRDGIQVALSEYHYLKSHGRYGVGGDNTNYFLELRPDTALSRTTIRSKTDADPLLRRAMTITSEMCQLKHLVPEHNDVLVTPKKLYQGLVDKGYDWDKLLDTRGFWVFQENEADNKPFLSTLDLLMMNAGTEEFPWYAGFKK